MRGSLAAIGLSDLACFRHAREIRQMQAMIEAGRFRLELPDGGLRARFVARDEHNARTHARERDDGGFADP